MAQYLLYLMPKELPPPLHLDAPDLVTAIRLARESSSELTMTWVGAILDTEDNVTVWTAPDPEQTPRED